MITNNEHKNLNTEMRYSTCEQHLGCEDNSAHLESALCMKRLGSPKADIYHRVLRGSPLLQAQGKYIIFHHPKKKFHIKNQRENSKHTDNGIMYLRAYFVSAQVPNNILVLKLA